MDEAALGVRQEVVAGSGGELDIILLRKGKRGMAFTFSNKASNLSPKELTRAGIFLKASSTWFKRVLRAVVSYL